MYANNYNYFFKFFLLFSFLHQTKISWFAWINFQYGCDTCGGWVEDKNISLVYHYGFVPEHLQEQMKAEVTALVLEFGFKPVKSHSAIEIKPPVVWSKGHAAQLILNEIYGKDWHKNHRIIYLGDDTSDEDVMKVS